MIDFYGTEPHYLAHLEPVHSAISEEARGVLTSQLHEIADVNYNPGPVVVAGFQDVAILRKHARRPIVIMEHGAGQTYAGVRIPNYINGTGRQLMTGILVVNDQQVNASRAVAPQVNVEAIGCPRLQNLLQFAIPYQTDQQVIVLAFRWDTKLHVGGSKKLVPEARSAWDYWAMVLPEVVQKTPKGCRYLIHAHPRADRVIADTAAKLGLEFENSQEGALRVASIWCQDNSSALWEAAAIGKPVIHLNSPEYRRNANHGLRFWEWAQKTGPIVNNPDELLLAIRDADKPEYQTGRQEFAQQWYGFDPKDPGASARKAAAILEAWFPLAATGLSAFSEKTSSGVPAPKNNHRILMECLQWGQIEEGEFWPGNRFYAGWLHTRKRGELTIVRQLGHLYGEARARELEQSGKARRV